MVEAELSCDGPDFPPLAEVQAPDLGALRGRDHRPSSCSARRGAPASEPATGSSARRPRIAWERAVEPRRHQGRRVCSIAVQRWKIDPSRGSGRGRRAAARDGRDDPRDCAGAAPWRPVATGDARPRGSAACSRRDRGRTPRRWRTGGCSAGRSSGVTAGPRRRSARAKLRLDSAAPDATAGAGRSAFPSTRRPPISGCTHCWRPCGSGSDQELLAGYPTGVRPLPSAG